MMKPNVAGAVFAAMLSLYAVDAPAQSPVVRKPITDLRSKQPIPRHDDKKCDEIIEATFRNSKHGYALLLDKSMRTLYVLKDAKIMEYFSVGIGDTPIGDKVYSGDKRTPVGLYTVTLYNSPMYGKSLYVSFPNDGDRQEFRDAKRRGKVPPGVHSPGDNILIHNGSNYIDYSDGCVTADSSTMKHLLEIIPSGSTFGSVSYIPPSQTGKFVGTE